MDAEPCSPLPALELLVDIDLRASARCSASCVRKQGCIRREINDLDPLKPWTDCFSKCPLEMYVVHFLEVACPLHHAAGGSAPTQRRAGPMVVALALLGYADSTAPGLLRPEAEFAALSSYGPMARRACVLVFHTLASSGWGRASLAAAAVAAGFSVSAFVAARR